MATLEWVAWFNQKRVLEPLGFVPPAECEARYYNTHNTNTPVGVLNYTSLLNFRSYSVMVSLHMEARAALRPQQQYLRYNCKPTLRRSANVPVGRSSSAAVAPAWNRDSTVIPETQQPQCVTNYHQRASFVHDDGNANPDHTSGRGKYKQANGGKRKKQVLLNNPA